MPTESDAVRVTAELEYEGQRYTVVQ
jgi:hypothetical protein